VGSFARSGDRGRGRERLLDRVVGCSVLVSRRRGAL
jgi:hypothetical protein